MRHSIILLFLLALPVSVWANGETLYVRPTGACANNGDGTAYACAASPGATGAFITFANVLQNSANTAGQVDPGDTLFVCGAHTTAFSQTKSGTSTLRIVLDGACPSDPGSIAVGSTADGATIATGTSNGQDYWTLQNLSLSGGNVAVIYCNGATPICIGNIYQYLNILCTTNDGSAMGMRLRRARGSIIRYNVLNGGDAVCGTGILIDSAATDSSTFNNNVVEFNDISQFSTVAVRFQGATDFPIGGPNYIRDNVMYDNGDGLYPVWADGIINQRNISHDNVRQDAAAAEGYGYAGLWSDNLVYEDNEAYGNYGRCIEIFAGSGTALGPDVRSHLHGAIRRNYCHGNNVGNFAFNAAIDINNGPSGSTGAWDWFEVSGNVVVGSSLSFGADTGTTGVVANNTFLNPTNEGCMYVRGVDTTIRFINNLCVMGAAATWFRAIDGVGPNTIWSHNLVDAGGTSSLAVIESRTYTSADITELDPYIVLADPLLLANRHPRAESLARNGGIQTNYCQDNRKRPCYPDHADIGAYQATSGDLTSPR